MPLDDARGARIVLAILQLLLCVYLTWGFLGLELPSFSLASSSSNVPMTNVAETPTTPDATPRQSFSASSPYTRAILLCIDALRSDFVLNRPEMNFTKRLILTRGGEFYVSRAHSPTVTLPRLKALMTGRNPKFIDLIHNLHASAIEEDSLIRRWKALGKRLVLYGDDTWLKIFPHAFEAHSDGTTSSFFTPDFVEVDENVTRHVKEDFDPLARHTKSRAWDVVVMHYLGLDHIGHQLGPDSARMREKLGEMDRLVERLVRDVAAQDAVLATRTLVVILSDHGMNAIGNHGGDSPQETASIAMFVDVQQALARIGEGGATETNVEVGASRRRRNRDDPPVIEEALQVDVAPTLACLMGGNEIPAQSMGCPMPRAFELLENDETLLAECDANAARIMRKRLSPEKLSLLPSSVSCKAVQRVVMETSREVAGENGETWGPTLERIALIVLFASVAFQLRATGFFTPSSSSLLDLSRGGVPLVYAASLGSSSIIENEHVVAYTLTLALTAALLVRWSTIYFKKTTTRGSVRDRVKLSSLFLVASLAAMRVARSRLEIINFSRLGGGGKESERANQNTCLLVVPPLLFSPLATAVAVVGTFALLSIPARLTKPKDDEERTMRRSPTVQSATILCGMLVGAYKLSFSPLASSPGFARLCLSAILVTSILRRGRNTPRGALLDARFFVVTLCLLLHRPQNAFLMFLVNLAMECVVRARDTDVERQVEPFALLLLLLGQCAFFALGNSHSVATMDIAGGYFGLYEYNREAVAFLTTVIVYTGPILAIVYVSLLADVEMRPQRRLAEVVAVMASTRLFANALLTFFLMRHHLFIFSVFAPRFAYELLSFLVSTVVSGVLLL